MKRIGQWWVPDSEELQLPQLEQGAWQPDHLEAALAHVTCWDTAIDGGAHIGSWSCMMAKRFQNVIAFEPAADTFECLRCNVRAFKQENESAGQIMAVRLALGEAPATGLGLADDTKYHGGNTGGRFLSGDGDIGLIPLDSWGLEKRRVGFIKLDLEGYELFALRGAERLLRKHKPIVLIEDKPRMSHRYGLVPHAARTYALELGMRVLCNVGSDWILGW